MNAYRQAKKAGKLSDKERIDKLKDNVKLHKDAKKTEKPGKRVAGGLDVYEDKLNEVSIKNARWAVGERQDRRDQTRKGSKLWKKHDAKLDRFAKILAKKNKPIEKLERGYDKS